MAFSDLKGEGKAVKEVRDNTTNKNLAKIVASRATSLVSVVSKLKINRTSTAPSAIPSQSKEVVVDINNAIYKDPPESNTFNPPGYDQTYRAPQKIDDRLDIFQGKKIVKLSGEQWSEDMFNDALSPSPSPIDELPLYSNIKNLIGNINQAVTDVRSAEGGPPGYYEATLQRVNDQLNDQLKVIGGQVNQMKQTTVVPNNTNNQLHITDLYSLGVTTRPEQVTSRMSIDDVTSHPTTATASAALRDTSNWLGLNEEQIGQIQRQQTTSSQTGQITSLIPFGDSSARSSTVTTPPVVPAATPAATPTATQIAPDTQRPQPRRQDSIPIPRRRDSAQPPAAPKDADIISIISGLDPIAESAAKDDKRLTRRLIKLMEELNKTVQAAERSFDLAHNAQGGTIRLPDKSHDLDIHQAVRQLLEGANNAELRRFQETSVKVNQMITEIRDKMNLPKTCRIQLYQLDDPKARHFVCVLPDDAKTTDELITHLVEEDLFEDEGDVHIFLRKHQAHQLTPKGRLWELTDGNLDLRFPGTTMDKVECEDGALVLDWVVNDKPFTIALIDDGIEEVGLVLDLPRPNRKTNRCVREHVRRSLPKDLSRYDIDTIRTIERPYDDTVADKPFHYNNFQPGKHSLVVKLRPRDETSGVTGEWIVRGYDNSEIEHGRLPGRSDTFPSTKFSLPISTKPMQPFLVTTYLVADALASRSTQLPAFRVQIRHLSIQALSLTVRLNDVLDTKGGATEDQYEEGFDLDNDFLDLGRMIDVIASLSPEEANKAKTVHESGLDDVFRKLFKARSFCPNPRDPDTDQVWKGMREHDRSVLRYTCEVHASDINEPFTVMDTRRHKIPDGTQGGFTI